MLIQPYPPVRVNSPRGPAEAVAYLGGECYVKLSDGTVCCFLAADCPSIEDVRMDLTTEVTGKAEWGPIRRGDLVRLKTGDGTVLRVAGVGGNILHCVVDGPDSRGARDYYRTDEVTKVGDVCPVHAVDIVTRKCVHCGLTDRAILAAKESFVTAGSEGVISKNNENSSKRNSHFDSSRPLWAVDVCHEIVRRPGEIVRIVVGGDALGDPAGEVYVRVVSPSEFRAAFGFDK